MWKVLGTGVTVGALLVGFSAAAYADGENGVYSSKDACWHDANLKTQSTLGNKHYYCAPTTHADDGQAGCHHPNDTMHSGCLGNYWELRED